MDTDWEFALSQGSNHFEGRSAVQTTLRRIANELSDLGVSYAIVGGMALFRYGVRRFTEDVDLLVTSHGLRIIHEELEGRGWRELSGNSKNFRDTETGVRVKFLIAGEFPGDGRPKPVSFPKPDTAGVEKDGIRYVTLETLIELKLASGMTNAGRLKDLADVIELVKALKLTEAFAESLNPYVQEKFRELQSAAMLDEREP